MASNGSTMKVVFNKAALLGVGIAAACSTRAAPGPAPASLPIITVSARDDRFVVREHMLAAVEMQLSGEPFATAMGRDLTLFSRDWLPPDIYFDHSASSDGSRVDLAGFSSGIES
ncbi:MAG TPA: hypothetical protein VMI75_04305, partial [Polyangiaceae bacterium]|nr:hypothetical protein [Polyangiaceae bacterium]